MTTFFLKNGLSLVLVAEVFPPSTDGSSISYFLSDSRC